MIAISGRNALSVVPLKPSADNAKADNRGNLVIASYRRDDSIQIDYHRLIDLWRDALNDRQLAQYQS